MPVINNQQDVWNEDKERLILYADIMGFKETVISAIHNDLKHRLLEFQKAFKRKISPLKTGDYLRHVQFSDSIIVVANGTDEKMFNLITKAATILMQEALRLRFPIKGVIAEGTFTYDEEEELYFGKPLVDAAILHDELHYYGIVVHHSAEITVKKYLSKDCPYTKEAVPLKKGKTTHYHLAWNMTRRNLSPGNITSKAEEWLSSIQEYVSGTPRIYIDNTIDTMKRDVKAINETFKDNTSEIPQANDGYIVS